jgi:hypothetical protein
MNMVLLPHPYPPGEREMLKNRSKNSYPFDACLSVGGGEDEGGKSGERV